MGRRRQQHLGSESPSQLWGQKIRCRRFETTEHDFGWRWVWVWTFTLADRWSLFGRGGREVRSALSAGQAGKENQFFTPKTWPASAVPHTHTHTHSCHPLDCRLSLGREEGEVPRPDWVDVYDGLTSCCCRCSCLTPPHDPVVCTRSVWVMNPFAS